MRWVWIDAFEEFYSGRSARAVKAISLAGSHVHDLYPGYPVMPHALIIEGLAQTGGILVGEANDFTEKVVLAKIPRIEFYDHAVAGDRLHYEVTLTELRFEGAIVEGKVYRNGELLAEAEIVYAHLDKSRAGDDVLSAKNFVFTKDHLTALLKLARGSYQTKPSPNRVSEPSALAVDRVGNNGRI
jgi:3-hydroxyacyl-[acyl-carrier-protein] dehydratase